MSEGFEAIRLTSERIAASLEQIAELIGGPPGLGPPGLGMTAEAATLRQRALDTRQGIFKLLVLGRFKAGKSTLLNALLGDELLPAATLPSTAVITVLVRGEGREVAVYETGKAAPAIMPVERFRERFQLTREDQESLQQELPVDRFRRVEYAQIECRHRLCENGVRLVDSPGLGEAASRAKLTTNFLQQAHAVVFVLDATAILGQDERRFVTARLAPLAQEGGKVFFVVNRINLIDPADVEDVRSWALRSLLECLGGEPDGDPGRSLQRRLFFVDAKGALAARRRGVEASAELEITGVPALERELESFLASDDRIRAEIEIPLQAARQVVSEAQRRIEHEKAALHAPLAELEERRLEADRRLAALDAGRQRIEETVLRFGRVVERKIFADLVEYVAQMRADWPHDTGLTGGGAIRLFDLDDVSTEELLRAITSASPDGPRRQVSAVIQRQVERYLAAKLERWGEAVPDVIAPEVDLMTAEIGRQVDEFALELDRIEQLFAGGYGNAEANRVLADLGRDHGARTALNLITLMLEDLGKSTGARLGQGEWGSFIRWLIGHALVGWAAVTLFGFFVLPFFLLAEAFLSQRPQNKLRAIVLTKIGEKIDQDLQEALPAKRDEISASVAAQFRQIADSVTRVLQAQIDETRAEYDRILAQRRDRTFSVEQECGRLDAVGARLSELAGVVQMKAPAA